MTQVYAEKDGQRYTLSVKGHATGSEKVCAAVSAISFAVLAFLNNTETDTIPLIKHFDNKNADAHFVWTGGCGALAAFELAYMGFKQLEMAEKECICVRFVEIV